MSTSAATTAEAWCPPPTEEADLRPVEGEAADQELALLAKALGHSARVQILRLLARRNSCICSDIVDELPLAQSTVSQHLKVLKDAGLIRGAVDGPRICYCIEPGALRCLKVLVGGALSGTSRRYSTIRKGAEMSVTVRVFVLLQRSLWAMRLRLSLLVAAGLALWSCSRAQPASGEGAGLHATAPSPSGPSAPASDGDCESLFEAPAGAEALCDQHDLATTAEVHWRSFAIKDARASVEARYRRLASQCGANVTDEPTGLSVTRGPMHLSTHDARPVKYPSCERAASPEHQTVVLISSMFQR